MHERLFCQAHSALLTINVNLNLNLNLISYFLNVRQRQWQTTASEILSMESTIWVTMY